MKTKITGLVIFALGAVFGLTVTKRYFKNKYEQIAQEEIDSVKEVFYKRGNSESKESNEQPKPSLTESETNNEEMLSEYAETISQEGYSSREKSEIPKKNTINAPHIISPDEFGEKTGYELISLTYYADGILTDDCDRIIDDMEDNVGLDFLNHFGEYEDASVFVRNDNRCCDYEILLDQRKYSDVVKNNPYLYTEVQ